MKLSSRTKKLIVLAFFAVIILSAAGCAGIPRDANNNIIYIWNEPVEGLTVRTSFVEIFKEENWFSAIFVYPLAWLINHLTPYIGVGGGIATVTVLVQGLLSAATINSQIQQQKMQLIQPEIKRIERKYEGRDDENSKMRMAAEQQQLFRKYDVNPASMLLVTFLQLPVIMAIFYAVQRSYAVQTGTFLGMNLQTSPMQGLQQALAGDTSSWMYLVLFAFMAVCQVLSIKIPSILQKRKEAEIAKKQHRKLPEKEENNMMQYSMILMILVFGFSWPAAMSLYWSINSLVNVFKTIIVQKIIDNKELNTKKGYGR